LGVLNQRLATRTWVRNLIERYGAGDVVGYADFPHVARALADFVARPAVQRGLLIPNCS
jgi:GSH-dependent disulfide-bond oxidoreductase